MSVRTSWYRFWRTSVELTADGTVTVRNVLRTYRVPVAQIFRLRRSEYGIRITLIDGRIVTAGVLQSGLRRRRSSRPDRAADAISAITQAVEAARSAQPNETTAAIDTTAPVRTKRMIRRLVVTAFVGPAILIASFFVPAAGINLEGRLRWIGVGYTVLSLLAACSLLRFAVPGAGKAYRHRQGLRTSREPQRAVIELSAPAPILDLGDAPQAAARRAREKRQGVAACRTGG